MLAGGALGQAQSGQVIGEVTALDPQSRQISLKTDQGEAVTVTVGDSTSFRRVPPGAKDLTTAARIAFPDLGVGDRIVAIGQRSDDRRKVEARTVIAMSRSDLAQKRLQEQEEWQKRGVSGTVLAVDPGAHTFTIKSGPKNVAIQPSGKTEYRRYSPDSVKFSDAQPSSLAEIKVGDQVRVLGDKAGDGASIAAERIVSGSFRQIAATISSVNAETGEVVVKDLATKKTLTVRVNADSTMRRLPPAMAAAMARRYQPGAAKGEDTGQTLDRLPAMPVSELKRGDAIMLSSTTGSDPARVTAVMLLAGVEPLLTASPTATRDIMSGWNLGGGGDQ
jgi:transcription antitermination factor NusG